MHLKPQPNIPALQTFGECVACGERASAFCNGCRVTPYCSAGCQRRDWGQRHRTVCHNLRRQSGGVASRLETEPEPVIPAAAPLRRPRSPATGDAPKDAGTDRFPPRKFGPPGSATAPTPVTRANNSHPDNRDNCQPGRDQSDRESGRPDNRGTERRDNRQGGRSDNRGSDNRAPDNRGRSDNRGPDNRGRSDNRGQDNRGSDYRGRFNRTDDGDDRANARPNDRSRDNIGYGRKNGERPDNTRNKDGGDRNFTRQQSGGASGPKDEDWGPKPDAKPEEPASSFAFKPKTPSQADEHKATPPAAAPAPAPSKLVPDNCLIDLLPINSSFNLTTEATAESCGCGPGFLCVSIGVDHTDDYARLLEPFDAACTASEAVIPEPGDTVAYLFESEGAWYRARCLSPTRAALLDAARVVSLAPDKCRRLQEEFAAIPEFSCHLESDNVKLNDQMECTVVSKSGSVLNVTLTSVETGVGLGAGTLRRWLPPVRVPTPAAPVPPAATGPPPPPPVPRPAVSGGRVLLVDATAPARVFVRPAGRARQAEFDDLLCEVAMYAADENTPRLTELPAPGQTVLAQFADGLHYRAVVQRVSTKLRRCLLEYIEYGNAAVVEDLSTLCPCPDKFSLASRPTLTSHVTLDMQQDTFSDAAAAFLDKLKDDGTELTLTIPSGEKTAPSKTPIHLTVAETNEDVNKKVDSLSMPEWKKILERGGDVLETERLHFSDITYVDPPAAGGDMDILDCSMLKNSILSGHLKNAEHARKAFALAPRIEEYCNSALAKDSYLPNVEELCIAMCPIKKQWLRAVLLLQDGGPGGAEAQVLFYDYGYIVTVPVKQLRKMMPEFARGIPAAVCSLEIKGFPENPTPAQLERARQHLRVNELGVGSLTITRSSRLDIGEYQVDAPALIQAIQQ